MLKSTDISVISIGNTDELLFKNWSFGNYINFFKNFLNGKHWLTSYFIKKITALFILNFQTENFKIYNFKIFMSRVIKKNYSFPVIYYYYTSSIPLLNQFVYLSFFNY